MTVTETLSVITLMEVFDVHVIRATMVTGSHVLKSHARILLATEIRRAGLSILARKKRSLRVSPSVFKGLDFLLLG